MENGKFGRMGREAPLFIIITAGKHAGSVLDYHHLSVSQIVTHSSMLVSSSFLFPPKVRLLKPLQGAPAGSQFGPPPPMQGPGD